MTVELYTREIDGPIGRLRLRSDGRALVAIEFADGWCAHRSHLSRRFGCIVTREPDGVVDEAARQIESFLEGRRLGFDLPLDPGGTATQRVVWRAVQAIPPGEVRTYGALARMLGRGYGARAVGHANGANPLPIVIPCHRVIGADGTLRGYAGGVSRKHWLLRREGAPVGDQLPSVEAAMTVREPGRIAVPGTGIYCRGTCRYTKRLRRAPLLFRDAVAAEEAGFRACRVGEPGR